MPFVVALLCWFVLSVPTALTLGRVVAVHGYDRGRPSTADPSRPADRILVNS
ncbi:MAG TPA: hypothetical protein VHT97_05410 [Acidimicrobiales bacterium]|jgi:hypothetical protein|nr:hypothetical protein [Acidimicrobiales bacterium]